jgi:hypothetical protein
MKKIIYFGFAVVALTSCKKDRTCTCDTTSSTVKTFTFPSGVTVVKADASGNLTTVTGTTGTDTYNYSSTSSRTYKKVTKKAVKSASGELECVSIKVDDPATVSEKNGNNVSPFLYSGGAKTSVSSKYNSETKCTLK